MLSRQSLTSTSIVGVWHRSPLRGAAGSRGADCSPAGATGGRERLSAQAWRADSADPEEEPPGADETLEDAAEDEQEYLRGRLREELKREPTEEELNEWLRRHTEGY